MKTTLLITLLIGVALVSVHAQAEQNQKPTAQEVRQQQLQRIYNLRMQIEQERARDEAEARANVRLHTDPSPRSNGAPSVGFYRQDTRQQLARFEQQFRCLDVDVDSQGGNTVVICGDNSGDISGRNVSAGRDLITVE